MPATLPVRKGVVFVQQSDRERFGRVTELEARTIDRCLAHAENYRQGIDDPKDAIEVVLSSPQLFTFDPIRVIKELQLRGVAVVQDEFFARQLKDGKNERGHRFYACYYSDRPTYEAALDRWLKGEGAAKGIPPAKR